MRVLFLCAVQLQHLVEVILVHVRGVGGVAYLQVGVVQVVAGWADGGGPVAAWWCAVSLFH